MVVNLAKWVTSAVIALAASIPLSHATTRIAQITDMHIDPLYRTGSDPTVPGRGCHDPIPPSKSGSVHPAGPFGDFDCDAPPVLVASASQALRGLSERGIDALYWTGDDVAHLLYNETYHSTVTEGIRLCAEAISAQFVDSSSSAKSTYKSVYSATSAYNGGEGNGARAAVRTSATLVASLGNHDAFPTDSFTPSMPLYSEIAAIFERNGFLSAESDPGTEFDERTTFLKGGYYARRVAPGVVAVSLNTILWYSANKKTDPAVPGASLDPAGQFEWLEATLERISSGNGKAHILGHVPPGFDENSAAADAASAAHMHERFNERFIDILIKYASTVEASFYGHEHTDTFRVLVSSPPSTPSSGKSSTKWSRGSSSSVSKSASSSEEEEKGNDDDHRDLGDDLGDDGGAVRVPFTHAFLAPAVTPWRNSWHRDSPSNNPGVRVYNVADAASIDVAQWYTDLAEDNARGSIEWEKEYVASEAWRNFISDGGGVDWLALVKALASGGPESDVFIAYREFNLVSHYVGENTRPCNKECFAVQICSIVCAKHADFDACVADPPAFVAAIADPADTGSRRTTDSSLLGGGVSKATAAVVFVAVLVSGALIGGIGYLVSRRLSRASSGDEESSNVQYSGL